jgi:hypothetical protein
VGVTCRDSRERTRGWDGFCPRSTRKCSWDRRGRAGPPSASNPAKFGPGLRHDSVNASRRVRAALESYAPGHRAGACRASPSKFRGVCRGCTAGQEGAVRPRRVASERERANAVWCGFCPRSTRKCSTLRPAAPKLCPWRVPLARIRLVACRRFQPWVLGSSGQTTAT